MVYILTPTRARFAGDVETRSNLLKSSVGDRYPMGFEVILGTDQSDSDLVYADKIVENLKCYTEDPDFLITVHAPLERKNYKSKATDVTTKEGYETLVKTLKLAKMLGAEVVNVHLENFYSQKDLLEKGYVFFPEQEKSNLLRKAKVNMTHAVSKSGYDGKICVENMPFPLMGDAINLTPENMIYDPLINSADDLQYLLEIIGSLEDTRVGACVDTCHYGISKKAFDAIRSQKLTEGNLKNRGFLGLSEEYFLPQPALSELPEIFKDNLYLVHLSGFYGIYNAGQSFYKEGLIPGAGELGPELKDFLMNVRKIKDLPINVEIGNKDFKNPVESKIAMEWLVDALKN